MAAGKVAAIEVMRYALPTPRSVTSSANHMMSPVPAVSVMIISSWPTTRRWSAERCTRDAGRAEELARARDRDEGRRLQERERDREVAGVLRELGLAGLPLVQRLEVRDDDAQQLHDDRRGDVRHDARGEDRQLQQRAAGEQVRARAGPRSPSPSAGGSPDVGEAHERRRNVRTETVDGDDREGEEDLPPEIRGGRPARWR
jgi:hypothetical protein